jgi:hypothetical protein
MRESVLCLAVLLTLFTAGCSKEKRSDNLSTLPAPPLSSGFVQYVIPKGEHYATQNNYKTVDLTELKFTVRFDSSCIYRTQKAENQSDINKLYGFADNGALHQQFSARFGWRWSENALRLFAYTYNNGERASKELAAIPVGKEVHCTIKVNGEWYIFTVDEKQESMLRQSTTPTAKGYQLYPYFGGDETAPHEMRILIREEK